MQPNQLLTWQIGVGPSLSYRMCLICLRLEEPKSYGSYAVIAQEPLQCQISSAHRIWQGAAIQLYKS